MTDPAAPVTTVGPAPRAGTAKKAPSAAAPTAVAHVKRRIPNIAATSSIFKRRPCPLLGTTPAASFRHFRRRGVADVPTQGGGAWGRQERAHAPVAVEEIKRLSSGEDLDAALAAEQQACVRVFALDDARAWMAAFRQKRPPRAGADATSPDFATWSTLRPVSEQEQVDSRNDATEVQLDGLREKVTARGEEALGRIIQDLLENPWVNSALTAAFEARGKASQAQEVAMDFLNLPSAAQIERLTRRVRSVSQRLEAIEDAIARLEGALEGTSAGVGARFAAIEQQGVDAKRLMAELAGTEPQAASLSPGQEPLGVEESGDPSGR